MSDILAARDAVTRALGRELLGPATAGRLLDLSSPPAFETGPEAYGPWLTPDGQEILDRDAPTKRYGVGVLYPREALAEAPDEVLADIHLTDEPELPINEHALDEIQQLTRRGGGRAQDLNLDDEELDLSSANELRQSTLAVTFLLGTKPDDFTIRATISGGRYRPVDVRVADTVRTWWVREPVELEVEFDPQALAATGRRLCSAALLPGAKTADLDLDVTAFGRDHATGERLVTISVTNRTRAKTARLDERCLFQSALTVTAERGERGAILPYPGRRDPEAASDDESAGDDEDRSIELLYRHAQTFAIGHGCAAEWDRDEEQDRARRVKSAMLPEVELPSVTPDIRDEDGRALRVSMARLAGLDPGDDGAADIAAILSAYRRWIDGLKLETMPAKHTDAARAHIRAAEDMLDRMQDGVAFLAADATAARAFRLANEAMLEQQLRTRRRPRTVELSGDARFTFTEPIADPDWRTSDRGYWRPFQIGFLLATARSLADPGDANRELVDLVFFPTGGGKTEAYLAQTAFSIFYRRLHNPGDAGVHVVMRYTLRLLTAQQFERASALICAMDRIRARGEPLGSEISIGIWLGGSMTPNSRSDALTRLRALERGDRDARNPFLVRKCPWCGAQMGAVTQSGRGSRRTRVLAGYRQNAGSAELYCPDSRCPFSSRLPVEVVDEDIYQRKPSLIIGTVDKFAAVAWRPDVRHLFGVSDSGTRTASPPGLIIQDELHLISGPLGSLAGLYETLIEELCTDRRGDALRRPKIVASTATIRRYRQQVQALYGRDRASLFPPHGLSARDNFFGRLAVRDDGTPLPGRRYVGVYAPGLGSIQTAEVRTLASLLQAAAQLPDAADRDPWFTLMAFFNSLRELANSLTLLQSDIPDYLKTIRNREGLAVQRSLRQIKELTSRLGDEEIPAAIEELETPAGEAGAVDVCLASSIIEVGMDIERLSLMTILGQPKSTSQYIQVTGRIGRLWRERPGLVVVIYGAAKPRDRSHYERFRSYHERLYAAVEATSATPFALPVLERALHAVLVGYVRQFGPSTVAPWPVPALAAKAADIVRQRVLLVDPAHAPDLETMLGRRLDEWARYQATTWSVTGWRDGSPDDPLIRGAGEWAPEPVRPRSWETLRSMRNVDAGCRLAITPVYAGEAAASTGRDEHDGD